MPWSTFGVLVDDKVVGKVVAENMAEAWDRAVARWGKEGLRVHLWHRGG